MFPIPLNGIPWVIENNAAQHNGPLHRLLAYAAFTGREGVVGPMDCLVTQLTVPGGSVHVAPGAFAILNRALNSNYQAYANYIDSTETVAIAPTGSGGGRSDLLILRVKNSSISGEPWSPPVDLVNGPYMDLFVIQDVPNTTYNLVELGLGYTGIALARIDIPASTATILTSMIKDVRSTCDLGGERVAEGVVASTHYTAVMESATTGPPDYGNNLPGWVVAYSPSGLGYPSAANGFQLPVPSWATAFDGIVEIKGLQVNGGCVGLARLVIDGVTVKEVYFDENASTLLDGERIHIPLAFGNRPISAAQRGQILTCRIDMCFNAFSLSYLRADNSTTTIAQFFFKRTAAAA